MNSSCIQIKIGNKVLHRDRVCEVLGIALMPNSPIDKTLVCMIKAKVLNQNIEITSAVHNFKIISTEDYEPFYPSIFGR